MQIAKNKTMAISIAIILLSSMAISLFAIPTTNAHDPPWNIPTHAYVTCTPGTVGLGQYTTIVVWVDRFSPTATGTKGQLLTGFTLNITKPDGTTQIIGPWTSSSAVGSDAISYTPDQLGTYTFVFSWPGNTIEAPGGYTTGYGSVHIGDFLEGATSKPCTLAVQQENVPNWPEAPLPTDYWTRPINAANRGWTALGSNWLKGSWLVNNFQPGGTVPLSAHVLWSVPLTAGRAGGIADAQWPGNPADANDYETPWTSPIIMNGVIYYNSPPVADSNQYGYYAVSLYTGQQLWYKNGTDNGLNNPYSMITPGFDSNAGIAAATLESFLTLTQGQLYKYASVNGQGVLSYLIMVSGSTWYFLDASTGNWLCSLINVPSGTAVTDENGDLLRYTLNSKTGNILCWNSSQSIRPPNPIGTAQQEWRLPIGSVIDAINDTVWTQAGPNNSTAMDTTKWTVNDILPRSGYTMNVTSDSFKGLQGDISVLQDDNRVPKMIFGRNIANPLFNLTGSDYGRGTSLGSANTFSAWTVSIDDHVTAYSPFPDATNSQNNNLGFGATLLMNKEITVPIPGKNLTWTITSPDYGSQTFHVICKQLGESWCYSLKTGDLLWGPTTSFDQMDYYGLSENVYYGKLIQISQYGGWMAAYNVTTGDPLWTYNATATFPYESAYGDNMPLSLGAVCDGCAILYSTEHSPTKPLWRESYVRCVNLTDGSEVWKLLDFNLGLSIADGYIVSASQYDNQIYCIGKGPSATTVEAPQIVPAIGSSVMITGTVTDQSPGATAYATKYGLTTGVAAVSDASQQGWMEYLYQQQPKPANATGVPVSLDTFDPNGNFIHVGDVTSDNTGAYGYMWAPEVPGTYQIIATFAGSSSYGSSHAQTYLGVGEAAPTASPYPVTTLPPTEMYFAISTIAIIVAIAIATILMLRKRP